MGNIKVKSQTNLYLEYSEGIEMSCSFPLLGLTTYMWEQLQEFRGEKRIPPTEEHILE